MTAAGNATYVLNALGQRVKKTAPGGTTWFVYDEAGHLLGEYNGSGVIKQEIIWLEDIPVVVLRRDASGNYNPYYIHTDHLNTPRQISRPNNNVVRWRWDGDPFGVGAADADPDGDTLQFVFNLRFPGQYYDAETGLHYNYFRDYDPQTGRYIESDPIGLDGGLNTYGYVAGNPLGYIDPFGLDTTISIARDTQTQNSITGAISVTSNRVSDTFTGYYLENRSPPNPRLPVPPGSYDAFVDQRNGRKDRIELFNVPNATDIQIHVGNFPNDAEGCFLPGTTRGTDRVGNSSLVMDAILDIVKRDGGKIKVVVSGPPGVP